MTFSTLIRRWQTEPLTAPNIAAWSVLPARLADFHELPSDFPRELAAALRERGILSLYSHQAQAWAAARRGENLVIATGTASGKTLCYNLPVLAAIIENPAARALYLFPTKALAQDQFSNLNSSFRIHQSAIYDGDTPQANRSLVRKNARIVLSNPDMLHAGILPHHANWAEFFRNLRYVVIDELHTYRGVFGSHVANVIRRLKRAAAFYGAKPQFILTSATIANPAELAEKLIEEPVALIERDGSARGERHFILYNPPVIDESIGLRKSATQEAARLANDLLETGTQSVIFTRSRRSVEILLSYLIENRNSIFDNRNLPDSNPEINQRASLNKHRITNNEFRIRGYRSGYLPSQRREIEKGLRDGSVQVVVATNALELGIDIGGLGAALLVGYPGSVASVRQQAGRAGRGESPAAAMLIATANPLDQFLAHHPEYLLERSPEQGLVNPDHLLILLNHIRCALFELPFGAGEGFGRVPPELVSEYLGVLAGSGEAHQNGTKTYWMADAYPAAGVSLRSASPENVILHVDGSERPLVIGEVDIESAPWMVHPRAVYLHEGQQYFVQDLNMAEGRATLIPVALDYFTEPMRETSVQVLSAAAQSAQKAWGEVQVTTQVTGFRKRSWIGNENLGEEPLDLSPTEMQTTAYWLSISDDIVESLSRDGLWTNAPNDYGPEWPKIREHARARDGFRCQVCGRAETTRQHNVHHKIPFRMFMRSRTPKSPDFGVDPTSPDVGLQRDLGIQHDFGLQHAREQANRLDNLVTLCPECHKKAETNVRVRSGLAGLGYALANLAPLFLMCDNSDLGLHLEPVENSVFGQPSVVLYDQVPAGIGFSEKLFEMHEELLRRAFELVSGCPCEDGCPSCVGPAGENGMGGKMETIAILKKLSPVDFFSKLV